MSEKPTIPLDETGCPDLQALVERAGRRYTVSIGEMYIEDPVATRTSPTKNGPNTTVQ
jgi:hypothetical protein